MLVLRSKPKITIRAVSIGNYLFSVLFIPPKRNTNIFPLRFWTRHRQIKIDDHRIRDRWGEPFAFYPAVPSVLQACRSRSIPLALASRTRTPDLARDMLKVLHIIPSFSDNPTAANNRSIRALDYFDYVQIFPASKIQHFTRIQQASGLRYEDMLFFDDEARNRNVQMELGVTFYLVRDGLTKEEVDRGFWEWRKRIGIGPGFQGRQPQEQD